MQRNLTSCTLFLIYLSLPPTSVAQTRDAHADQAKADQAKIDQLTKDVTQLKTTIAAQERRIAELEKTVRALQAIAAPAPAPIPSPTPLWQVASNWVLIKKGMSEAQVVEILGPPTSVETAIDVRTLLYQPDSRSTVTLKGSVTLTDDRVTALSPPAF